MSTNTRKRGEFALVTGGSRGIGAETVLKLCEEGFSVCFTYRNKKKRADAIARKAQSFGAQVFPIQCDITRLDDLDALFQFIAASTSKLDTLVLNASGGLEQELVNADPDYPFKINRNAQINLVEKSLPLLTEGSTIAFVTSHWAHLYGEIQQLPSYEPVAASKHAGEVSLRNLMPSFSKRKVRLIIITGDIVMGTITAKLLERKESSIKKSYENSMNELPSAKDMAIQIVNSILDNSLESGTTVVVGRDLSVMTQQSL